jgi:hypothetical protein
MSRAYRVSVRESLRRVLRGDDHIRTKIELLPVLPAEELAQLLEQELGQRGFARDGNKLVRQNQNTTTTIDPHSGEVTIAVGVETEVTLESEQSGWTDTDWGRDKANDIEAGLRQKAREELQKGAQRRQEQLSRIATEQLERQIVAAQPELDEIVNRVTATALKQKASQIGRIKELTEDPASGNLTIVLEV